MTGSSEKDRDFEAYLKGDSALSRAYREEAQELPPGHVDAHILAEARRADAAPITRTPSPFSGSWMVPASVAAVVVLAVSVVVLLPEGRPGYQRQRDIAVEDLSSPPDAPGPAPLEGEAKKSRTGRSEAMKAAPAAAAPAPEAAPTPGLTSADEVAEPAAERDRIRLRPEEFEQVAPAFSVGEEPAPREQDGRHVAPSRAAGARPSPAEEGRPRVPMDADAQLARIEALIAQGQLDAARDALALFRRAYPEIQVPERILRVLERGGH